MEQQTTTQSTPPPAPPANPEDKYKGVKNFSWLALLIAYLKLLVPLSVFLYIGGIHADNLAFKDTYGVDRFVVFPDLKKLLIFVGALKAGLACFSFYAGNQLQKVAPNAIKVTKAYLLTYLVYTIIASPLFAYEQNAITYQGNHIIIETIIHTIGPIVRATIIFTLCFVYLNKSKRVKATYANPKQKPDDEQLLPPPEDREATTIKS